MPKDSPPTVLPDNYYLDNFNTLVEFVAEHYWQLLNNEEQSFYRRYQSLDTPAQRLYIRLLSRRKSLFRQSKLHYEEIGHLDQAAIRLEQAGLVAIDPQLDIETLLQLFTRTDIQHALGVKSQSGRRAQLQQAISQHPQALAKLRRHERIIAVLEQQNFTVFRLLFFGNLYQDLTAFVLRDLGLQRYEPYRIDTDTLPFRSRSQLDKHLHYYACRELFDTAAAQGTTALLALNEQLPEPAADDHALQRRTEKLALAIARQLEREQANDEALSIYRQIVRAPARERLTRLLAKAGDTSAALALCTQIIEAPTCSEEFQFAAQFGQRLAKKNKMPWQGQATPTAPATTTITLPQTERSVELTAAAHFQQWGQCYYVENALITGVLGLAIWDIVFAAMQGAFYHPFQNSPADFNDPDFRVARQHLLLKRFAELENGALPGLVADNWQNKFGITNPLVSWRHLNIEVLELAIDKIPLNDWLALFEYLLQDLRNHRNGLPDLIFFPASGGYQLIEVKGPGDRLQNNQRRWMAQFNASGINHSVVNVEWESTVTAHA